jgi:hypothetical protein
VLEVYTITLSPSFFVNTDFLNPTPVAPSATELGSATSHPSAFKKVWMTSKEEVCRVYNCCLEKQAASAAHPVKKSRTPSTALL